MLALRGGGSKFQEKEWPRINIFLMIPGGAAAGDGATTTECGEGESAEGAEGDDGGDGGRKGEKETAEETCRECEAAGGEQRARDARRYHQGTLVCLFVYCCCLL